MKYKLEVIAFTIESCVAIEQGGAHRIELCADPADGGTTPSYGMIKAARKKTSLELFPIIRPRGGDFLYSDDEYAIMKQDVELCKQTGCDGVVLGLLQKGGSIDAKRTAKFVEAAYPMEVTFHRAFDRCREPFEALEQIIEAGCQRILTSGQKPIAMEGADLIAELVKAAGSRVVVMPGSGVRETNVKNLAEKTGAVEFHSSLRSQVPSKMDFVHPAFAGTADTDSYIATEAAAVKRFIHTLNNLS